MFALSDGHKALSATDLTNHLALPHLTQTPLAGARREYEPAQKSEGTHADLLRDRGDRHEREQLAQLGAECGEKAFDLDLSYLTVPGSRGIVLTKTWLMLPKCSRSCQSTVRSLRRRVHLRHREERLTELGGAGNPFKSADELRYPADRQDAMGRPIKPLDSWVRSRTSAFGRSRMADLTCRSQRILCHNA